MDACGTVHIVGLRTFTPNTGVTTIWPMLFVVGAIDAYMGKLRASQ
ncbi:hypothetical protein M233_09785 [Xylella fastidiosa subsp. multiplex Griffin-1]|nr:hypothetical protein M233_09785 [Xylella fastidiosa subsp. multiplex Griffin-1]